jgi:hypothetical protein
VLLRVHVLGLTAPEKVTGSVQVVLMIGPDEGWQKAMLFSVFAVKFAVHPSPPGPQFWFNVIASRMLDVDHFVQQFDPPMFRQLRHVDALASVPNSGRALRAIMPRKSRLDIEVSLWSYLYNY